MWYLILLTGTLSRVFAEDNAVFQACVDKISRKGYQPWQEWSDHYTCHRYRCEIRDGKYFIASVGCRKPKIPENAVECHEYIENENVEFPTCCARLRCVIEANGEKLVQTRGQPGELFSELPWKEVPTDKSLVSLTSMAQENVYEEAPPPAVVPAAFSNRGRSSAAPAKHIQHDINNVPITWRNF